jgi:hypothetical protein
VAIRVVVVARDAVLWQRLAGAETALDVLARRRGRAYDPVVVDAVRAVGVPEDGAGGGAESGGGSVSEDVLAAEPEPIHRIGTVALDRALDAVGDFADLRSHWTRGRSARLAGLAAAAGRLCGLPDSEITTLRRAAAVADLGAVGMPAGIWTRPGPLGVDDTERLRLHPYLSERVLGRCPALRPVATLAGAHHERLDGSGYHRGSAAAQLPRWWTPSPRPPVGPVDVFGHSYGAHCALEAALRTTAMRRLALYELALVAVNPPGWPDRMQALLDRGRHAEVVVALLGEFAGCSAEQIEHAKRDPSWPGRVASAHTVVRETRTEEDYLFDPARFAGLSIPTLLLAERGHRRILHRTRVRRRRRGRGGGCGRVRWQPSFLLLKIEPVYEDSRTEGTSPRAETGCCIRRAGCD